MQLNTLTRTHTNKQVVRIGRGHTRGKTSGRGHKGQKSRAGHHIRPAVRDIIKRIPKLRGHGKNRSRTVDPTIAKPESVNVGMLSGWFEAGTKITPNLLLSRKLIRRTGGRTPEVKILGNGTLDKKFIIADCLVSVSARAAIVKAGGEVL